MQLFRLGLRVHLSLPICVASSLCESLLSPMGRAGCMASFSAPVQLSSRLCPSLSFLTGDQEFQPEAAQELPLSWETEVQKSQGLVQGHRAKE